MIIIMVIFISASAFAEDCQDLFDAVQNGDVELVKQLVNNCNNINIGDQNGWTPLMYAIFNNHIEIVKLLIQAGADLYARGCEDDTWALLEASYWGYTEIVQLFINAGVDVNYVGGYVNPICGDSAQWTPLMSAALGGQTETARLLIKAGASINARAFSDETALFFAVDEGHTNVVRLLIRAGADVNIKPKGGYRMTALALARKRGHNDIAELLLQAGAEE
jgi:ankyrin repeat protein